MSLRKRTQGSETLSDVFTCSSAEELDTFEDERNQLLDKPPIAAPAQAAHGGSATETRNNETKKVHKVGAFRRLLGKGRGDHDAERRKSVAARRSLSKARRLRRKSGARGSQSSQSQPETECLIEASKVSGASTSTGKRPGDTKSSRDQSGSKEPVERILSAKELIAAAEARDKENASRGAAAKHDSLKRKADAVADDAKTTRSVRRKSIKPNYRTNRSFLFRRQVTIAATKRKLGLL